VPLESAHDASNPPRLPTGGLEGAGHLPNLDRAEEFNNLAMEFLKGAMS
jgi:pimeloyl-ACP methyl ester carboxylesterase